MAHQDPYLQVALLFLSHAEIHTEPIWAAFIAAAAELELRARVPPPRPAAPRLFPPLQLSMKEMNGKCWRHGGYEVGIAMTPRREAGPGTLMDQHVEVQAAAFLGEWHALLSACLLCDAVESG